MPGIKSIPSLADSAAASATPPTVSWSVSAQADSPVALASRATTAGASVPSEAVE